VPQDLSLTGMDDIPVACLMVPALTTVRQPVGELVRNAFARVTDGQAAGPSVRVRQTVLAADPGGCANPARRPE